MSASNFHIKLTEVNDVNETKLSY